MTDEQKRRSQLEDELLEMREKLRKSEELIGVLTLENEKLLQRLRKSQETEENLEILQKNEENPKETQQKGQCEKSKRENEEEEKMDEAHEEIPPLKEGQEPKSTMKSPKRKERCLSPTKSKEFEDVRDSSPSQGLFFQPSTIPSLTLRLIRAILAEN